MDDLSKMLNDIGIGCYVDNVCVNHVFYADYLCLLAQCAIALQLKLLNIYHRYSIIVDLNFNALKSFCFAFTPKPYKLSLPCLHINNMPLVYINSKYLEFTFSRNHKDGDDMLRQMRTLYARSNRIIRIFAVQRY